MSEWCIENPENIPIKVDNSQYRHLINVEQYLSPLSDKPSALLILNQKIDIAEVFLEIWHHYKLKVCADGGANRLYELFGEDEAARSRYLPDYIVGDLDSLNEDVEKYYRQKNVVIIKQLTQYSTDFSKCLDIIALHWTSSVFVQKVKGSTEKNHSIELYDGLAKWRKNISGNSGIKINTLALGGINGRFDQTIHSISQLYQLSSDKSQFNLCYLSSTDLIFLIPSQGTLLTYSKKFRKECIGNCGLLPLGAPTVLQETCGLKWDVGNWSTSIQEGKVSSSNRFVGEDRCLLKTKDSIVISVEIEIENLKNFL
ncbi:hypothetical protein ZYGR_0AK04880 [Zygosaccharomyces rouxii]|uniref:Thiamine pyrophosphokinase n=1 Tax=Zygosaccharomyces rouxii TaxID=4956 RepID=A0A1Q3ADY8_ZYGRO|nr:hypothetical protein ZYGR_0AK04880 [Zygosaccharomyces rouxii]